VAGLLYQISIVLYWFAAKVAALFNPKAKLFTAGRKSIWHD